MGLGPRRCRIHLPVGSPLRPNLDRSPNRDPYLGLMRILVLDLRISTFAPVAALTDSRGMTEPSTKATPETAPLSAVEAPRENISVARGASTRGRKRTLMSPLEIDNKE